MGASRKQQATPIFRELAASPGSTTVTVVKAQCQDRTNLGLKRIGVAYGTKNCCIVVLKEPNEKLGLGSAGSFSCHDLAETCIMKQSFASTASYERSCM
jgi:hypothetical protein